MIDFYFNDETGEIDQKTEQLIRELLTHAAKKENVPADSELSITFMTDEAIREINADYRGKDQPTDVISFALEEMGEGEVQVIHEEGMPTVLGDIIISTETAEKQAAEYGHTLEREIGFLALHGFLHLLGYDHMNEEDERKMFGRQKEILTSFGLER